MKIALISINGNTKVLNFASPIHTYAFQQFLLDHGIETTIINYRPNYYGKFDPRHPLFYYIDHPHKDPEKQAKVLKKWRDLFYEREIRYDKFQLFLDKYYIQTEKSYTIEDLDKIDLGFDCYICVTDVIWNLPKKIGFERGFLLAAKSMEGKKKIAYAGSRGSSSYPYDKELEFLGYLKEFNYISSREKKLQKYIKEASGLDVPQVIDPVFLKDRSFYEEIAIKPNKKRGFVLIYIVMVENTKIVEQAVRFAQKHDLDVYELGDELDNANVPYGTHHDVIYDIGIEEWLGYMMEAEYIFTNSFHACCFSAIFEKQFFAGMRNGDKIDSVLELLDLSWRRINNEIEGDKIDMPNIDYNNVKPLIDKHVKSSTEYILNAIESVKNDDSPITLRQPIEEFIENSTRHKMKRDEQKVAQKVTIKTQPSFLKKVKRKINKIFK